MTMYGHLMSGASVILGITIPNQTPKFLISDHHDLKLSEYDFPIEFILQSEPVPITANPSAFYFSLLLAPSEVQFSPIPHRTPATYLGVILNPSSDEGVIAIPKLSIDKTIFTTNYSTVDGISPGEVRPYLLAGVLYSLETTLGDRTYTVRWNFESTTTNLISFLPTTWYESTTCQVESGIANLQTQLSTNFRAYTTEGWCRQYPEITYSSEIASCGTSLGPCLDPNMLCSPSGNGTFVCTHSITVPELDDTSMRTIPPTTGSGATIFAVILIFVIVLLLAYGLSTSLKLE